MAEKLAQKLRHAASSGRVSEDGPELTSNTEVEAKIAKYKEENPKYVEYIKALPRDRLENIAVLRKIETTEQKERIQAATSRKLEAWLETRPEEAKKIAEAVAKVAPDQQAGARIRMIQSAVQREGLRSVQSSNGVRV
jgi:hypothetical protein